MPRPPPRLNRRQSNRKPGAPLGERTHEDLDVPPVRRQVEDLRADVGVHADRLEMPGGQAERERLGRLSLGQAKAELGVGLAGLHGRVGRRGDARRDAHEHLLHDAAPAGGGVERRDLGERVDDHVADAVVERQLELGGGLVVAVKEDVGGRKGGRASGRQLAARGDVEGQALLGHELDHRPARERLAGIDDARLAGVAGKGRDVGAALVAQRLLVVDEQRRAERVGELDHVAAADLEVTGGVVAGGVRVDEGVGHGVILRHRSPARRVRAAQCSMPSRAPTPAS